VSRVANRTAVITGAAQGIGAAAAHRLAADGYRVAVLDIDPRGTKVADEIRLAGGRATFALCDVADETSWADAMVLVHRELGPVDALVSNALVTDALPLHELSVESWNRQLAVNLTGAFHGVRACLPDLARSGTGSVVMVASVHAWFGLPGVPGYATTKAGLTGLTRQLAVEYGGAVRFNCVVPGPVLTAQWDQISPEDRQQSASATLVGRMGRPAEVAAAISFLISEDASFITGASLAVDGGWSVGKNSS
jgi:NAD(P)-dependent dehydrogenase (short-subunit alcohol dehydrogenase family)